LKLLLDFNLSPKLLPLINQLFKGSSHLQAANLVKNAPDEVIWRYAKENGFAILTADRDFLVLSARFGPPPKVIWLQSMNYRTKYAADLIQRNALRIAEFESTQSGVLLLHT
jgi:predicted nuclease of predicted toxin-antitoxin system